MGTNRFHYINHPYKRPDFDLCHTKLKIELESWKKQKKRAGKKSRSAASFVNSQLKNFQLGLVPESQDNSAFKPSDLRKTVSAKLSDLDIRGAVRLLSSDAKLLSSTPETLEKLKKKHPEPHPDTVLPSPPEELEDPLICTREDVEQAIKSFRNGSWAAVTAPEILQQNTWGKQPP